MKIEFDLLANAEDSLQQAIKLVAWPDEDSEPRRLKGAVQAIAHGLELLLKERLRRVHPCLIWENVDKYPNPNSRTVTAEIAISRLTNAAGIHFHQDDLSLLRSLRAMRNAIEHFKWSTTKAEADALVGKALEFAFHFSRTELNHEFFGYHTKRDDTYQALISSSSALSLALAKRAFSPKVEPPVKMATCYFCRARAFDPSQSKCTICGESGYAGDVDDDQPF